MIGGAVEGIYFKCELKGALEISSVLVTYASYLEVLWTSSLDTPFSLFADAG